MQFLRAQKATKKQVESNKATKTGDEQVIKKRAQGLINAAKKAVNNSFGRKEPIHLIGGIDSRILLFEDLLRLPRETRVNIFVSKQSKYAEFNHG